MIFKGKTVFAALLVALVVPRTRAAQKPELEPSTTLEEHAALIKKSVALHDEGDYDGAIKTYQEILRENPDDVSAQYELGFSYF